VTTHCNSRICQHSENGNSTSTLPTGGALAAENCYPALKCIPHSCNKFCDICWSSFSLIARITLWILSAKAPEDLQMHFLQPKTRQNDVSFMIIQIFYALIALINVISSIANIQATVKKVFHILFFPLPCCEFILSHVGVKSCHKIKYSTLVVPSLANTLIHKSDL